MFADLQFTGAEGAAQHPLLPDEALIATGTDARVIVALGEGRFQPVRVTTGRSAGGRTEILSGLSGGEKVVVSGQFLLDSEASLSGALGRLSTDAPVAPDPHAGHDMGAMPAKPAPPTTAAKPDPHRFDPPAAKPEPAVSAAPALTPIRSVETAARESIIAADLTIEGKIEGAGHVRIAGKFKGDVRVQGNLTIEQGAKVSGGVSANKVTLAGELNGNVESAQQIELQQTGVVNGDLKTGSLTVAAGSRIRGHVECGWGDKDSKASTSSSGSASKVESGSVA